MEPGNDQHHPESTIEKVPFAALPRALSTPLGVIYSPLPPTS